MGGGGSLEIVVCVLEGRCRSVGVQIDVRNLRVMEGRCRLFGRSRNPCVRDVICQIISTLKSHSRSEKREGDKRSLLNLVSTDSVCFVQGALRYGATLLVAVRLELYERGSRLVGGGGGGGDAEPCVGNFTVDADCPGCR